MVQWKGSETDPLRDPLAILRLFLTGQFRVSRHWVDRSVQGEDVNPNLAEIKASSSRARTSTGLRLVAALARSQESGKVPTTPKSQ